MTHHEALENFAGRSRVLLHEKNDMNLAYIVAVLAGSREMTAAFHFITEHTVNISGKVFGCEQ
jgi:hypothetical protein